MCVDSESGPTLDRTRFLGAIAALPAWASVAFGLPSAVLADAVATGSVPLPEPPRGMSGANARATAIAAASPFVRSTYAATDALARSIADPELRSNVLGLLADPRPTFAARYPDDASRTACLAAMLRAGFVDAATPLAGLFPANVDARRAPQPFWSAAGSTSGSHHAYPGGLLVHECFNASIATQYAAGYDAAYFGGTKTIDRDVAIGAALYHDAMKTVVFQWNDDGTPFAEATIAGTGAHHVLSGAEAIARGRPPRFVIALLSAHAAPSLGDETKVVAWCRAAALLAGVDPVAYGLVRATSTAFALAPEFVPIEAFVNHLSDHDYVLSVHAMHAVRAELDRHGGDAWYANGILAHRSAIGLYHALAEGGRGAFDREVARVKLA